MVGEFVPRVKGEIPRISIRVNRTTAKTDPSTLIGKQPCKRVEVVCYSHDVLAEDGDAESDKPWEIIALNGYPNNESAPIAPEVLMHNHFGSNGGTATNMSPEEFEKALRESFEYWKNKGFLKV